MMFGQRYRGFRPVIGAALTVTLVAALFWTINLSPAPVAAQEWTFTPTWTWLPPTATPAPEINVPIPASAVVGRVLQDTLVYWAPRPDALVPMVLPAGKTVWVLGLDTGGRYYKIAWVDAYLWVPREALGPNPDPIWHGMPLPTAVVE